MNYTIRKEKVADVETIASAARRLRECLGGWDTLESIPASHWKSYAAEYVSDDVLKIRKEHDRKKFSVPAVQALRDLNRGLASFGLGQIDLDTIVEEW